MMISNSISILGIPSTGTGKPKLVPYESLTAFEFDGFNERMRSPDDVLDITGSFSMVLSMKTTSAASLNCLVCKDTTAGVSRSWNAYYRGVDSALRKLYFTYWTTAGTAVTIESSTAGVLDDGAWHHIVITCTADATVNGLKMYVDKLLDAQGTAPGVGVRNYTGANSDICIGSTSGVGGGWFYNGRINGIGIWNGTILSGTDVSNLYDKLETPETLGASILPDFDNATYDGSNWTVPDFNGAFDFTSEFMEVGDRYTDAP